ncbi:MAG: hypothetical protein Roseis2KO_44770 [Roseivirga sp.]
MVIDTSKIWSPGDSLNLYFMNGTVYQKHTLLQAVDEWTTDLDISFHVSQNPSSEIRVTFEGRLFASVGKDALNVEQNLPTLQITDLGKPENLAMFARHEFGHVLGCVHEHQSPNFPYNINEAYVLEKYTNFPIGWSEALVKYNFFRLSGAHIRASEFDPDSVMLYELREEEILEGVSFSYNQKISPIDQEFVHQFYSPTTI